MRVSPTPRLQAKQEGLHTASASAGAARWEARTEHPHCFGYSFTSTSSITLLFDANTSDTMISEPTVAFTKPNETPCQNAGLSLRLSQNRGPCYLELTIFLPLIV